MKKNDEKEPIYTAFSPVTWIIVIQLLMIHWKIAYNLPIQWWQVFLPVISVVGFSVVAGILYLIGATIAFIRSRMTSKPLF